MTLLRFPRPDKTRHYRFPWREIQNLQLLIDGEQFYPEIFHAIRHARYSVYLEIYLCDSGQVINQLIDALHTARSNNVEIYLFLDDIGAKDLSSEDRQRLKAVSTETVFYNSFDISHPLRVLLRDHRKLLIIDNQLAYTGGAGMTDDFISSDNQLGWHDIMLRFTGQVVDDCQQLFTELWNQHGCKQLTVNRNTKNNTSSPSRARLLSSQGGKRHEITHAVYHHVSMASKQVWLISPYFVSTRKLRKKIMHAAKRGVDVRLLLPSGKSDHPWVNHAVRRFYHRFLRTGVRIFEYQPRFIHAKLIICDNWLTLGSSNLDRWELYWNFDANIELICDEISEQAKQLFAEDARQSREITLKEWMQRPWLQRIKEWGSSHLVYLLEKFSRKFRRRAGFD